MRDLKRYRQRRDPDTTPEPFGDESAVRGVPPGAPALFVVQQHAARRMHWDLRLEIGGVLVSWAVPRGPTLDPAEKRLAVQTEDHPLEYADFEGVIPEGNYGAGAMILWDRGAYRSIDGNTPAEGLEVGKLDLEFHGQKLRGRFALVRTRGESGRDWLLLRKGAPPEEEGELVERLAGSVLSGLEVEELAASGDREELVRRFLRGRRLPKGALPSEALRPMLARRRDDPFVRDGWIFELKYDGVRALGVKEGIGAARILARTGGERTDVYPEVALALRHLPVERCVVDGEITALDEAGRSSFQRIQRRFTQRDPAVIDRLQRELPVCFHVFDLLSVADRDLRRVPLAERKALLAEIVPPVGLVRFVDHVERDGRALYDAADAARLEGIVAKRADSRYRSGERSDHWQKVKIPRTACFVVVGYAAGRGTRGVLGSLLIAAHDDEGLVFAGAVGSGLRGDELDALTEQLATLTRESPAFRGEAVSDRVVVWVEPELVCEVRYTERTNAGLLRQPVFRGLRDDVRPEECRMPGIEEAPLPVPAAETTPALRPEEAGLVVTRREKVFWPEDGFTKGDLLDYYERIWPWLAPYLRDRPVVLTRYPDGIEGKSFFQKNAPDWTPDWVQRREVDGTDYFLCNDVRTLLHVINSGAIPLHVWSARASSLEHPDWLILDLDPKQAPFEHVVEIARHSHRLLDELHVPHGVKSSGQDGLHVVVPLGGAIDHDQARQVAEVLARVIVSELPEIATITRPVAARGDKVYVDFLQNGRGKLIAAPFSVRPRPGAPVSTPLRWAQVTRRLDPVRFNLRTTPRRMEREGDPWEGLLDVAADVPALLEALGERLGRG